MDEVVVREYDPTDRQKCIALLKRVFQGTSDEQTFKWRFETEGRRKPILVCGLSGTEVVSFNSWISWDFNYKDMPLVGYQSGESATHPAFRGKGLFGRVLSCGERIALQRGTDFLFGFPSRLSYGSFYRAGYYRLNTYHFFVKPTFSFRKRRGNIPPNSTGLAEDFFIREREKICPVFDDSYQDWRYISNPKNYEIVRFRENSFAAMFFLRFKKWKVFNEAILLDCQFTSLDEMLIAHSFDYIFDLISSKASFVRTFFSQQSDRGDILLKKFPFASKSKSMPMIIKPLTEALDKNILLNHNCWDVMPHCVDEF